MGLLKISENRYGKAIWKTNIPISPPNRAGGMWPFRFAMQRRTKRGHPHMTIYLLTSGPKNGVELMDGVQNITRGWWRPTPGSIYPML